MNSVERSRAQWQTICRFDDLNPNAGVCALVDGSQVAVIQDTVGDNLYAVSNYDPIGHANVMSRGIIGSLAGRPVIASPLYKQHFDLITGVCIEQPEHQLAVFEVRIQNDAVQVRAA